ncbi:hypothetical protein, partial [Ornithinibacillus scapharcae]|uniref:hypothetical protein n=1 Tax=Ornithinibacillus scapharcae TaxID=1147159 RepID=UPI000225C19D
GFAFWIVPDKNLIFIGVLGLVALISVIMLRFLPPKEEGEHKPLPQWLNKTKNVLFYTFGSVSVVIVVGSFFIYIYSFFD